MVPLIDDAVSLWPLYPSWDRCREFQDVIQILFVGMLHDTYEAYFHDVGSTALEKGVMLSKFELCAKLDGNWLQLTFTSVNDWLCASLQLNRNASLAFE